MPRGNVAIFANEHSYDAKYTWGLSLSDGAISTLLAPPPVKKRVSNASRLEKGKRIDVNAPVQYDSRELTLEMHIIADSFSDYLSKYRSFIETISSDPYGIRLTFIIYGQTMIFFLRYLSCTQFSVYNGTLGKFAVRFVEEKPNLGQLEV